MNRPMVYFFAHDQARQRAAQSCQEAPDGWVCRITPPNKSRDQESKYHAQISDIAEQVQFHGQELDAGQWKRLLIDAFHFETKDDPDLAEDWKRMGDVQFLPALNHPGVVMMGFQSRDFSRKLGSAFIEWLNVFAAENGVQWKNDWRDAT